MSERELLAWLRSLRQTCCWEGESQDCTGLTNLVLLCCAFFNRLPGGTPAARRSQIRSPVQTSRPEALWRHLCGLMQSSRQVELVRPAQAREPDVGTSECGKQQCGRYKSIMVLARHGSGLRLDLRAKRGPYRYLFLASSSA